ncbi:MAG: ATP-binding cassette domain-containing protein [Gemmatimonadetes bacterium]|jgi:molybdate transport system ATP-binding protein|nr:ATP-binding cassette domain-containing protein [Gemmatimonadota bacterium]
MGAEGWGLHVQVRVPLDAIDLDVDWRPGRHHVAILGPSGSGKSTLLRALAGLEPRAEGRVTFGDEVWLDSGSGIFMPAWERRVGWVPQDALLFPHLSLRENLAYAGAGRSEVEKMAESLFLTDLLDRRPRFLSGGERQRVALGRALLSAPRMLLLDEPFSALDRPLRAQIAAMVRAFARDTETPIVLVSHDEHDAGLLADERWVLVAGRLTANGTSA